MQELDDFTPANNSVVPTLNRNKVGRVRSNEELAHEATRFIKRGQEGADNTVRAYASDWERFTSWCANHQTMPLPADEATLILFVTDLAAEGKKWSTIVRNVAAIRKAHHLQRAAYAGTGATFKDLLEGISRENKTRPRQAPAFTMLAFKQAVQAIDLTTPGGVRDRALLLVGLAGAFRRQELVSLDMADVTEKERAIILDVRQSKTNQKGEASEKALFYSADPVTCPVRALRQWMKMLREAGQTQGPLFVQFHKGQRLTTKRLSAHSVNAVVKEYLGEHYSAHSLRASFVTIAKLKGAEDSKIMNQTKHKTVDMIRRYTRLDDIEKHNAAEDLGL